MARGDTFLTSFKARKRSGKWTDDDHGQLVGDLERWSQTIPVAGVGCSVIRSVDDAAILTGNLGFITFDTKESDNEGFLRSGVNTIIVPPGYGGLYDVYAAVGFTAALAGLVALFIQVTRAGVTFGIANSQAGAPVSRMVAMSPSVSLYPGDLIKVGVNNASGATITPAGLAASATAMRTPVLRLYRNALLPRRINS